MKRASWKLWVALAVFTAVMGWEVYDSIFTNNAIRFYREEPAWLLLVLGISVIFVSALLLCDRLVPPLLKTLFSKNRKPSNVQGSAKSGKRPLVALVVMLVVTNAVTGVFLVRSWWVNCNWKWQISGMAMYAGSPQAHADFRGGKLRLYELVEGGKWQFANRYNGPFEIWYRPYYETAGQVTQQTEERFVKTYNSKMRNMYEHPERFTEAHKARQRALGHEER